MLSKILIISLAIIWLIEVVVILIDDFSNNENIKAVCATISDILIMIIVILDVLGVIVLLSFIGLIAFVLITAALQSINCIKPVFCV